MKAFKAFYKGYLKFDRVLKCGISIFCGGALLVLTVVVFICALLRTFFNYSVTGSDEFSQYLMVWVVLLAAILCAEADDLVNVDAVFYLLPDNLKPYIHIVAHAIACIFLVVLSVFAVDTVERIRVMGTYSVGMPFFPMWLLYLPATFCSLLMGIEYAKLMIKGIYQILVVSKQENDKTSQDNPEGGNQQ